MEADLLVGAGCVAKVMLVAATGFPLEFSGDEPETAPPTERELRLIRETIDPERAYTEAPS